MTEFRIVDVRLKPWWKFWKIPNVEVIVEDEKGNRRKLPIRKSLRGPMTLFDELVFADYVGYKYCTGDQFWDLHQRKKKGVKLKLSDEELIQKYAEEFVGKTFDCAVVMSKEASP